MSDLIELTMQKVSFVQKPSLQDYIETDKATRMYAEENIRLVNS
jgi:1-deoxy-D-xylulose-5-phosphate reductoisomerase